MICLCASCHERADIEHWGERILREYKQKPWVLRQYRSDDKLPTSPVESKTKEKCGGYSVETVSKSILSFRYMRKHHQTTDSMDYLKAHNLDPSHYPTFDSAIEIRSNVLSGGEVRELCNSGWDAGNVSIVTTGREFEFDRNLIDESFSKQGTNRKKYCLSKVEPPDFLDAHEDWLKIHVDETRYHTVMEVLPSIKSNKSLRHVLTDITLQNHGIPHAFCLHFVLRFSDGCVLCMKRSTGVDYEQGKWSITEEEQLREEDLSGQRAAGIEWFDRAVFEEAFELGKPQVRDEWENTIRSKIAFQRIWSVIAEEKYGSFGLAGIVQFYVDSFEYADLRNQINRDYPFAKPDPEGNLFIMEHSDLITLAETGSCQVSHVFDRKSFETVRDQDLHSTSWYRVACLLTAMRRQS